MKSRRSKKRTIVYRILSNFGRFWDPLRSRKTQQIEKVPAKTHAKKSMKKKRTWGGKDKRSAEYRRPLES